MSNTQPGARHRKIKLQANSSRLKIVLLSLMVLAWGGRVSAQPVESDGAAALLPSTQSAITFRLALRELWQYQVTWTRSYIVSVLSDLEDAAVVEEKLVKNQENIGNAVKPYYGGGAGDRLASLLREHIVIATRIVQASKASDSGALARAQEGGRENADSIANLLSRARNPLWGQQFLKDKFYAHLEYVTRQVDFRLKKDWDSEIRAYDDGLKHVLLISDMLAEGIIRQFPERFKE